MNDLISRKALLAEYDRVHIGEPGQARKLIADAPSVDAPHWATEQAYKNGYKKGYADALAYARRELNVIHECVTETLGMVKELKATASRAADINVGANLSPNEPPKGEE